MTPIYVPIFISFINLNPQLYKKYTKILALDIDKTIYHSSIPIENEHEKYLNEYIREKYKINDTDKLINDFKRVYGSVLKGCLKNFPDFSEREYIRNVINKINYKLIKVDTRLKEILQNFKGNLVAFTNGSMEHSRNVLKQMEIEEFFDYIFHIEINNENYIRKPEENAYKFVEQYLNLNPKNIFFIDDREINIITAQKRFWNASLLHPDDDIKEILREIYEKFKNI